MKKLSLGLMALLFMVSCQSQKMLMELNLEKGHTYHHKSEVKSKIKQNFGGMDMEMDMLISGDMSFTVKELGEGYFDLEAQYERMQMDMKMPMMELSINTEEEESSNPMGAILSKMTEQTFMVRMGKNGKILDVNGTDELFARVFDEVEVDLEQQKLEQMKAQIKQAYGKETMIGNMQLASTIFPDESIKVGDSWEREIQSHMNGQVTTQQITYTLLKKENDRYYLKADSDLKVNQDMANDGASLPFPMKFDMDGEMHSDIVLDAQSGWIKTVDAQQKVKGKVRIEKNERIPKDMEMPMEYDITLRTTD